MNVCISGVPVEIVNSENISDIIIAIGRGLSYEVSSSSFNSYAVPNQKFIIVHLCNLKHKQSLINKIRVKKSLMVEEVFDTECNGQISITLRSPYAILQPTIFNCQKSQKGGEIIVSHFIWWKDTST